MDDNNNILHDLGSVLAIVAYAFLLIYYFKILGLIISFSTIVGFLIISKNVKAINDLLLKNPLQKYSAIAVTLTIVFVAGYIIDHGESSGESNGTSPGTHSGPTDTPTVVSPTPTIQPSDITNSVGMEFKLIPAGEFDMGSPQKEAGRDEDEGPVHRVKIANTFYMSKYEITQKQWREIMGTNPSYFTGDNLPVEQVSWNEVQEFISRLNEKEGVDKYRLPSEPKWEYAARAGTTTRYYFGEDASKLDEYEWFMGNSDLRMHEVGQKKPNPWGLYDMQGSVWEWVQDVYHNSYDSAPADGSAWEGNGAHRVIRGGSFDYYAGHLRTANRNDRDPGFHHFNTGFRLVMDS